MQPNETDSPEQIPENAVNSFQPQVITPNSVAQPVAQQQSNVSNIPEKAINNDLSNTTTTQPIESTHNTGLYSTNPNIVSGSINYQAPISSPNTIVSADTIQPHLQQNNANKVSVFKRKKFIFGSLAAFLILAISSVSFAFFVYIPNLPQNVWNTSLTRSGKQLDAAITTLSDPESLQKLQKNQIIAKGEYKDNSDSVTVDLNSIYDSSNADSSFNAKGSLGGETNQFDINIDVKTSLPEAAILPNLYINFSGLDDFGLDYLLPGISSLENTWIAIEQDTWQNILPDEDISDNSNLTQDEIVTLAKDFQSVANEYIFTDDQNKSVLMMNTFIGTEQSEGITANHYLMSINKNNTKLFCEALVEKIASNQTIKRLSGLNDADYGAQAIEAKQSCTELTNDIDESKNYDIWVNKKYKIFHKIRLYTDLESAAEEYKKQKEECQKEVLGLGDTEDFCGFYDKFIETGEEYLEFGQVYKGGDEITLFINNYAKTNQQDAVARLEAIINVKNLTLNGNLNYKNNFEDANSELNISLESKPYSGEVNSTKPEGAISLQEALERIGAQDTVEELTTIEI